MQNESCTALAGSQEDIPQCVTVIELFCSKAFLWYFPFEDGQPSDWLNLGSFQTMMRSSNLAVSRSILKTSP